jgi:hypothetical protein
MNFKRGILGAIMGGASGLQEGKKQEIKAEKAGSLEMMKALREENLARFKHGLDLDTEQVKQGYALEQKEKENEYALKQKEVGHGYDLEKEEVGHGYDLEKEKTKHGYDIDTEKAKHGYRLDELSQAARLSGEGKPGELDTLDATRIVDIGKSIEADYIKKGKQVPEWMLNDWNAARAAQGLPTVSQEKVKGYVRDKWKLDIDRLTSGESSGILSGVIKQVQEDQTAQKPAQKPEEKPEQKKLSINDVIASVKSGQKGMPQAGAATEQKPAQKPEEKPAQKPEEKPAQKANTWAGHADRQAEIQRIRQIEQLIDESAKAKNDQAEKGPWSMSESRSRAVRERIERLAKIRQLMDKK